jgi:PAS domain S-box-containing protein
LKKDIIHPNLNNIYLAYVITDIHYNIKENSTSFLHFIQSDVDNIKQEKLTYFFPDIYIYEYNNFIKIQSINNTTYYMKANIINLNNKKYYMFIFSDLSLKEELFNHTKYLNEEIFLYTQMLNTLQDGIYITDEVGKTLYVNDSFLNLSGLNRNELLGKTVYEMRSKGILPNSCCAEVIEKKMHVSTINNYYQGEKCLVSGSPIFGSDNTLKRTIAIVRDVSELDHLMKKLSEEKPFLLNHYQTFKKDSKIDLVSNHINTLNVKMNTIYKKAKKIANVDSTILVLGETGVGKDLLTLYIHESSDRCKTGNLIKINCGAIPEHLLESELFGYEDGAFTGALKSGKKGLFEEANNGTLFLDEIGDMPYNLQVKLLSAINDKKFHKVGGTKEIEFNARIISATNVNLKKLVAKKKFRADLYYRLNVISFKIPPLKERHEDIIPLARNFLNYYNDKYKKTKYFSEELLKLFLIYDWPGNIREMKNIIQRFVLISESPCIDVALFEEQVLDMDEKHSFNFHKTEIDMSEKTLKHQLEIHEISIIKTVLATSDTLKEAAKKLDIDISTLVRKKQKYNID